MGPALAIVLAAAGCAPADKAAVNDGGTGSGGSGGGGAQPDASVGGGGGQSGGSGGSTGGGGGGGGAAGGSGGGGGQSGGSGGSTGGGGGGGALGGSGGDVGGAMGGSGGDLGGFGGEGGSIPPPPFQEFPECEALGATVGACLIAACPNAAVIEAGAAASMAYRCNVGVSSGELRQAAAGQLALEPCDDQFHRDLVAEMLDGNLAEFCANGSQVELADCQPRCAALAACIPEDPPIEFIRLLNVDVCVAECFAHATPDDFVCIDEAVNCDEHLACVPERAWDLPNPPPPPLDCLATRLNDFQVADGTFLALGVTAGESLYAGTCGGAAAPEAIFGFTAPSAGEWVFSTARPGSTFDTVLYARTDCAAEQSEVACNDNSEFGSNRSLLVLDMAAGDTLYMVVDGSSQNTQGAFNLRAFKPADLDPGFVCSPNDGPQGCGPGSFCDIREIDEGICVPIVTVPAGGLCVPGDPSTICEDGTLCDNHNAEGFFCAVVECDQAPFIQVDAATYTAVGDLNGVADHGTGTCSETDAPDFVVTFAAPEDGAYTVAIDSDDPEAALTYFVRDGCTEFTAGHELACDSVLAADLPAHSGFPLLAGQRMAVFVEGLVGWHGRFTVTVARDAHPQ